jgi:uncharacterized protein YfdQ (DUF2303 family)
MNARIINHIVKATSALQQLDHIDYTDSNNCNTTTHDKHTMGDKLLKENCRRFNQAAQSPFLTEPLAHLVGKYGEGNGVADILRGEVNPSIMEQLDQ